LHNKHKKIDAPTHVRPRDTSRRKRRGQRELKTICTSTCEGLASRHACSLHNKILYMHQHTLGLETLSEERKEDQG
jgi:hypothetical protein